MMAALGEEVPPPAPVESLATVASITNALQVILPSMSADTATLKMVMEKLAVRFGMDFADLKTQWRSQIKALLPDMMGLCSGGDMYKDGNEKHEADVCDKEDEVEALDARPRRKRITKQRNVREDTKDKHRQRIVDDSDTSESSEAMSNADDEEDDADDDDVAPVKERRKALKESSHKKKKRKGKEDVLPLKKAKTIKQPTSTGLASLKELGRAAGVLNPQLYRLLNNAASTADAENILRDRLHDSGIYFADLYPSSREISAAKRKRAKEKELEGIDTNLIISDGRSRRRVLQRNLCKKERSIDEEDIAEEEEEEADDNNKDTGTIGFAYSDSDSSEASS